MMAMMAPATPSVATSSTQSKSEDGPIPPEVAALLGSAMPPNPHQVFQEDLETYKAKYNPNAPCGVSDLALQDESIRSVYVGLPPLPGDKWVMATYDPSPESADEGSVGGHMKFSYWGKLSDNIHPVTMYNSMTFVESGIYINPTRISPARCSTKLVGTAAFPRRITIDDKVAISIMVGMCMQSYITKEVAGNGTPPRFRRYISLMPHNQDWERWQSFHCVVFEEDVLYTPMSSKAIHLGSVLSPYHKTATAPTPLGTPFDDDMFSPVKSSKAGSSPNKPPRAEYKFSNSPNSVRYSLNFDVDVPAFDARNVQFDFDKDLPSMASVLKPWKGEIPKGSYVVAGYTAATYMGQVAVRNKASLPSIGCNLVWVIVCGTPKS
ncbi:hypothetical protein C8J57DRAFT_1390313 [Mycena rebaudengoi]|nr:hypothetical protein C8J57DRAFT_1390313 [Mycena rebaudengoi]